MMKKIMLIFAVCAVLMLMASEAYALQVSISLSNGYYTCTSDSDNSNFFFYMYQNGARKVSGAGSSEANRRIAASSVNVGDVLVCKISRSGVEGQSVLAQTTYTVQSGGPSGNNPPIAPAYIDPANGVQSVPISAVTLRWQASTDQDGDPVTYDVYLWKSGQATQTIATGISGLQYSTTTLEQSSVYLWQIVAKDTKNGFGYGAVWSFTTAGTSPQKPTAVLSVDDSNPDVNQQVTFDGSASYADSGSITGYYFDFGDGTTASWRTSLTATHRYTAARTYNARLQVRTGVSGSYVTSDFVTVPVNVQVPVNTQPVLTNPTVSPYGGTTETQYVYSVLYTDSEGNAPIKASVYIDGMQFPMSGTGDFASGAQFSFTTTINQLTAATHNYYFVFNDGQGKADVRLPESGAYTGPIVTGVAPKQLGTDLAYHDFGTVNQGQRPSSYNFYVQNKGAGALDWRVVTSSSWLSASPTSGTSSGEADTVVISVTDTSALSGENFGTVSITTTNDGSVSQTMKINVIATEPTQPVLDASPSHDFGAVQSGRVAYWTFSVRNAGTGTLNWNIPTGAFPSWLSISPTSGSNAEGVATTVTVAASANSVSGHSSAAIAVNSNGGTQSGIITIDLAQAAGNAPRVDSLNIEPQAPNASSVLRCTASVADADSNLDFVRFRWSVNGATVKTSVKYISGASSTQTDELGQRVGGEQVTCEAEVHDRSGLIDTDSVSVRIGSGGVSPAGTHLPQITSVTISPEAPLNDNDLTCTAWVSDNDGDLSTVQFFWYANGVLRSTSQPVTVRGNQGSAQSFYSSAATNPNEVIQCLAKVYDSAGNYDEESDYVTIGSYGNAPPISINVEITPRHPNTQQDLTCSGSFQDMDDNLDHAVFEWYVDGLLTRTSNKDLSGRTGYATDILSAGYTYDSDSIQCKVTVYDTGMQSSSQYSNTVVINDGNYYGGNRPIAILTVQETSPQTWEVVRFEGSDSYDPDGHVEQYMFDFGDGSSSSWLPSGSDYAFHTYSRSGTFYARLKVKDNNGLESDWSSAVGVYVGGYHPPYQPYDGYGPNFQSLEIVPSSPMDYDNLDCRAQVYDSYGQLDRVEFSWYVNGALTRSFTKYVTGYNDYANYELTESYSHTGDTARCRAVLYNDRGQSVAQEKTATIGQPYYGGSCSMSFISVNIPSYTYEDSPAIIEATVKNTGGYTTNLQINVYADSSFEKREVVSLSPGSTITRRISVPLPKGEKNIRVEASFDCGRTESKYGKIIVYPSSTPAPTPQPEPEPSGDTLYAKVLTTYLDVPYQAGKSFAIIINSPTRKTFDISISGIPQTWLSFPKSSEVLGRKLVYVYVNPMNMGTYPMNVTVTSPSFSYSKMLSLYVAPEGSQQTPSGTMSGMFVGAATAWVIGLVGAMIIVFFVLLHYGYLHLRGDGTYGDDEEEGSSEEDDEAEAYRIETYR